MNKQTAKNEQLAAEKAERLAAAKNKLRDGVIGAISVDTCIFTENGYRLDSGILKHLEQFKGNAFKLVFSEITLREIHRHIAKHSDEAKDKLIIALRSVGKYWTLSSDKQGLAAKELLGGDTAKAMASKRLKDFTNRCDAHVIEAIAKLDVTELLNLYFNVQAPFESSAEKKSEFPDAIALLSLQGWAKKEGTAVLLVTKDKGCKRFCKESEHLFAVDDLSEALTLIQERDAHCATLCRTIESKIANGDYPDLIDNITDTIRNHIWDIDWDPEASSAYSYDAELENVEVLKGEFGNYFGRTELMAVDYRSDMMVVQASITIEVRVSCDFSFSVRDTIDHDMMYIGGTAITIRSHVTVDVLLTFKNPNNGIPEVIDVEVIPSRQALYFGSIEPDHDEEDPNSEYY